MGQNEFCGPSVRVIQIGGAVAATATANPVTEVSMPKDKFFWFEHVNTTHGIISLLVSILIFIWLLFPSSRKKRSTLDASDECCPMNVMAGPTFQDSNMKDSTVGFVIGWHQVYFSFGSWYHCFCSGGSLKIQLVVQLCHGANGVHGGNVQFVFRQWPMPLSTGGSHIGRRRE